MKCKYCNSGSLIKMKNVKGQKPVLSVSEGSKVNRKRVKKAKLVVKKKAAKKKK